MDKQILIKNGYDELLINLIAKAYNKGYDLSKINKSTNPKVLELAIDKIHKNKKLEEISFIDFCLKAEGLLEEINEKLIPNLKEKTKLEKGLNRGINPNTYKYINSTVSNIDRLNQVGYQGLFLNKDIYDYLKQGYNTGQIEIIFKALDDGYNIEKYIDSSYDRDRLQGIHALFRYYKKSKLKEDKMFAKIVVSKFTNKITKKIILALKANKDISVIFSDKLAPSQIGVFLTAINEGIDFTQMINKKLDNNQLNIIMVGIKAGVDVTIYNKPEYSFKEMQRIYYILKYNKEHIEQIDLIEYLNLKLIF